MTSLTLTQAREAIYQHFVDNYGTTTAFSFEAEDEDEPPSPATGQPPDPWVRISVRANTGGGQESLGRIGTRSFWRDGTIIAQIFTPINQGLRQGDVLAQTIRGIFEAQRFGGIVTNDGIVQESPPEDRWIVHIVEVFFNYEEIK